MRRLFALFSLAAPLLFAQSLPELIGACERAPLLKAADAKSAMYAARSSAAQSARYPALDALFSGTYLRERPVVYLQGSFSGLPCRSSTCRGVFPASPPERPCRPRPRRSTSGP